MGDMRVWVGCLGCYNDGRLIGEWADAADADPVEMGLAELGPEGADYRGPFCKRCHADEFWCFDQEGLAPFIDGECSPAAAQALAETLDELDEDELRTLRLYVEAVGGPGYWSAPDWSAIAEEARDRYVGEGASVADIVQELIEETGGLRELQELADKERGDGTASIILRNIDWDGVAEEYAQGWSEVRTADGTVAAFSA